MTCQHPRTEIRHKIASNGQPFVKHQCLDCGRPAGNHIAHKELQWRPQDYPPWDHDLAQLGAAVRSAEFERMRRQKSHRWWSWYNSYLSSPEWKERRRKVMARACGTCEACGIAPASSVHHTTYEHVGDEPLWELRAICEPCHDRLHDYQHPTEGARDAGF